MAGIGERKHEVNGEGEVRDPSGDVQPKRIKMNKSDDWTTLAVLSNPTNYVSRVRDFFALSRNFTDDPRWRTIRGAPFTGR